MSSCRKFKIVDYKPLYLNSAAFFCRQQGLCKCNTNREDLTGRTRVCPPETN